MLAGAAPFGDCAAARGAAGSPGALAAFGDATTPPAALASGRAPCAATLAPDDATTPDGAGVAPRDALAAVAAGAEAALGALPGAGAWARTAPVESSGGIVRIAPSFMRLGSPRMNEEGFASKIAFDARDNTARSCDCVTAMATSFSDCPGFTVTWVADAAPGADAAAAELAESAAKARGDAKTVVATAIANTVAVAMPTAAPRAYGASATVRNTGAREVERAVMWLFRASRRGHECRLERDKV